MTEKRQIEVICCCQRKKDKATEYNGQEHNQEQRISVEYHYTLNKEIVKQ
jgi:hypothetical protein